MRYPRQATFHPLKYLSGVAAAIEAKGGVFFAGTIVSRDRRTYDGSVIVKTDRGTITARAAVVATNSPIVDRFALHTKMAPYRTYAMAFEIRAAPCPMRCTGTRSIPIIMCACSRAKAAPITSSSAAPITRAAKPMTPTSASRRWKPGRAI